MKVSALALYPNEFETLNVRHFPGTIASARRWPSATCSALNRLIRLSRLFIAFVFPCAAERHTKCKPSLDPEARLGHPHTWRLAS